MADHPHVTARTVLDAVLEIKRLGSTRALEQLEEAEPELASYVMEALSDVHRQVLALGGCAKASQRVYLDIQALVLTCITAMRHSADRPGDDAEPEAGA